MIKKMIEQVVHEEKTYKKEKHYLDPTSPLTQYGCMSPCNEWSSELERLAGKESKWILLRSKSRWHGSCFS